MVYLTSAEHYCSGHYTTWSKGECWNYFSSTNNRTNECSEVNTRKIDWIFLNTRILKTFFFFHNKICNVAILLEGFSLLFHEWIKELFHCFRCLSSQHFVRIGKWFVQPYDYGNVQTLTNKRYSNFGAQNAFSTVKIDLFIVFWIYADDTWWLVVCYALYSQ